MTTPERDVVLFVDAGMWVSFEQLAAAVRRRGMAVVHFTQADNPIARWSSRVNYDHTEFFSSTDELQELIRALPLQRVRDIQCPEHFLEAISAACAGLDLREDVRDRLAARLRWRDKADVHDALEPAGVPVPAAVRGSARSAAAQLGLPVVEKPRIGSAGVGVRVLTDESQLPDDNPLMTYEAHLPGESLCYAAVALDGQPLQDCAYRALSTRPGQGASSEIEVVADEDVTRTGRQVLEAIGLSGMVCLDLVRDADGTARVIDVNVRAWHSVVALHHAGVRMDIAYLASLGCAPTPARATARPARVSIFPEASIDLLARGRRLAALGSFLTGAVREYPVLGWRYSLTCLVQLGRQASPHPARPRGLRSAHTAE